MQTQTATAEKTQIANALTVQQARDLADRLAARAALGMVEDQLAYQVHLDGTISRC